MSYLQVGPDDFIAIKTLSDARRLAVFRQDEEWEYRSFSGEREIVVGDETYRFRIPHAGVRAVRREHTGYVLVISDNTEEPLLWRAVASDKHKAAVMKRFEQWQEGEDDRRREQTSEHPQRRAGDNLDVKENR